MFGKRRDNRSHDGGIAALIGVRPAAQEHNPPASQFAKYQLSRMA